METKPREAELSLSIPTQWAKAKANPVPPILHVAQERWSGWRFVQVSNDFVLRSRLFSTRAVVCGGVAGRPPAKGPVLPIGPRLLLRVIRPKNQWEL